MSAIIGHIWNRNGVEFPAPRPWVHLYSIREYELHPGESSPEAWLAHLRRIYPGIEFEFRPTKTTTERTTDVP